MTTYRLDPEPTDVDTVWCENGSGEFEKFEKRTPYGTSGVRWESEHFYYTWSELLAEYVAVHTVNPRLDVAELSPFPWNSRSSEIHDDRGRTILDVGVHRTHDERGDLNAEK